MSDDFAEKLRSIHFAGKRPGKKVTVDDHGTHTVEVTESADRQDVTVKPAPAAIRPAVQPSKKAR